MSLDAVLNTAFVGAIPIYMVHAHTLAVILHSRDVICHQNEWTQWAVFDGPTPYTAAMLK